MSASQRGVRWFTRVLFRWFGAAGLCALGAGCYATTPHRAEVATVSTKRDCSATVTEVFARSGFVQLATPPHLSMFFTARMSGEYTSFLRSGAGVGVTIHNSPPETGECNVTIEALSPDADCADSHVPLMCQGGSIDANVGSRSSGPPASSGLSDGAGPPCPIVRPVMCQLSYAPGADNDAAVDELARRVQVALGPGAHVN